MKLSKPLSALILIASALLLNAANNGSAAENPKSPTARNSQNEKPDNQERQTEKTPTPGAESSISTTPTQPTPAVQGSETSTNPQSWNDWFWQNFSTLLLAILATGGSIIALRTLDAIRDQARIASDAITKLERPWIFVGLEKVQFFNVHGNYLVCAFLRRRNVGRSPAWIIGGVAATRKLSESESLPTVPDFAGYPAYTGPVPIAQSEELEPWEQRFVLKEEEWIQFALNKVSLVVFGEVRYYDSFNRGDSARHFTRFCIYLAQPINEPFPDKPVILTGSNYWYFGGPEGYNRFT